MLFFSSSSAISMIDDLLTDLIIIINVSFSLYLLVMFISGAIARYSPCQILIPVPVQIPAPIFFQDVIVPFKRPLIYLTIRQLKQRAKTACIPQYSRMRKPQLIAALQVL